ncbi:DUF2283 domain-containing protein [Sanguibacter suaedae]|uniref:DUF2283 domain-containing protein n=1 Tax=Sanguibacter suaedae TaxID=2795737 RepID=A0A934M9Z4_9MICO|nr:DUF2283 domain-containing protein [Sanguibacter suaedae]MBI9113696.1 DUF2283 domain-containing protein [Sanguibacter suaedae]
MEDTEELEQLPHTVWVTWEAEYNLGYIRLQEIAEGQAAIQKIVPYPRGGGEVILDFSKKGVLLGIEFVGIRAMPPSMIPKNVREQG